jgi:hypothetical protein
MNSSGNVCHAPPPLAVTECIPGFKQLYLHLKEKNSFFYRFLPPLFVCNPITPLGFVELPERRPYPLQCCHLDHAKLWCKFRAIRAKSCGKKQKPPGGVNAGQVGAREPSGGCSCLPRVQVSSIPSENMKGVAHEVQPPFLFLLQHQVPD